MMLQTSQNAYSRWAMSEHAIYTMQSGNVFSPNTSLLKTGSQL